MYTLAKVQLAALDGMPNIGNRLDRSISKVYLCLKGLKGSLLRLANTSLYFCRPSTLPDDYTTRNGICVAS